MITYSDEDCTDMMTYHVLNEREDFTVSYFYKEGKHITQESLLKEDHDLLIEYAPKLFNTLPTKYDLHDSMLELVNILDEHRYVVMSIECEMGRLSQYAMRKHKSEDKAESLKKHIEAIRCIIGRNACEVFEDSKESVFKRALNEAYEKPLDYIPKKVPVPHTIRGREPIYNQKGKVVSYHSKEPIRNYLVGLKLPEKSDVIKEFIKNLVP